jgi:uncharacterized protein (TIGR03437 family)
MVTPESPSHPMQLLRLGLHCSTLLLVLIGMTLWVGMPIKAKHAPAVVTVNAASYTAPLAPGAIAAAFGATLTSQENSGTSVRLVDSQQAEYRAQVFFVSPGQINFLIPEQIARGAVQMTVASDAGVSSGSFEVVNTAPGLFTVATDGHGAPSALTTFDGATFQPVVSPDGSMRTVIPGTPWQPNFLILFGTGLRGATDLRVHLGGLELTPVFAGPQGAYAGLDQVNVQIPTNSPHGVVDLALSAGGRLSNTAQLLVQGPAALADGGLTQSDVETIIAQAVGKAQQLGLAVTVAVTDHEGNVLGSFRMPGARATTRIGSFNLLNGQRTRPPDADGLQDLDVPSEFAAISKAGTASFFSTGGNAFTSRTAGFIIQEHFPPRVDFSAGGPLFGVQFSQLPCSDVKRPNLPLGLSGDPGGVPVYKNGVAAGGVGVEGDGFYSVDLDPTDEDRLPEEVIAVSATRGYEAPAGITGDQILVDGIRLPFINGSQTGGPSPVFGSLAGTVLFGPRPAQASSFRPLTLGGVPGRVDDRYYPFKESTASGPTKLSAVDVNVIITQAAQQAYRTRAAIRRPLGTAAEVNIAVVDTGGNILGLFSTIDAPIFGFDVSAQKARTAAFFSSSTAGAQLRAAEGGKFARFADAAASDGILLNGTMAFSDRANGFLSRPFLPDGQNGSPAGPFSKPIDIFSPFNDGLQIALDKTALAGILSGQQVRGCTAIPNLPNGTQIFAGSVPLYKYGVLVGAIGISGDGIDQDDIIAATGSVGFEAPEGLRADQFFVRGVRLPYVKFPRHPDL